LETNQKIINFIYIVLLYLVEINSLFSPAFTPLLWIINNINMI